jgi:hypothetical protein
MRGLQEMLYITLKVSPEIPHTKASIMVGHLSQSQCELVYIPDITSHLCYFEENASARVQHVQSERWCFLPDIRLSSCR